MKKVFAFLVLGIFLMLSTSSFAQRSAGGVPYSIQNRLSDNLSEIIMPRLDRRIVATQDSIDLFMGNNPKIAKLFPSNIDLNTTGKWHMLLNGDRVWRAKIRVPSALGIYLYFNNFYLPPGAKLYVYNEDKSQILGAFTSQNNHSSNEFATGAVEGEVAYLEYYEPLIVKNQGIISISDIGHVYRWMNNPNSSRAFGSSGSCQVNVNCSEGTNWQTEKKSVAVISTRAGGFVGTCTGAVVNNVNQDCTPYFLTAFHCAQGSSASDLNQWIFYFNWEAPGCSNPANAPGANSMTGAVMRANSNDGGGNTGSDFALLEFNNSIPSAYGVYYAGFDASGAGSSSGVNIHHPDFDIKKIATYNSNLQSASWGGSVGGTHWAAFFIATANGHSSPEGGSSGSPIFKSNGRILGTLTGVFGTGGCSGPADPHLYGKVSFSWASNGTTSARRLRDWLDPANTGTTVMDGTFFPCGGGGLLPVAAFEADEQAVCVGGTVNFTDNSTGTPTSWNWTFPGGTPGSSTQQNPSVTYNTPGTYNVTLTVTNADGSDTHSDTSYIFVQTVTSTLPLMEGFESGIIPAPWAVADLDQDNFTWSHSNAAGGFGTSTSSVVMDNYSSQTSIAGTVDFLIGPSYDFTSVTNATLTFDVAYARYNATFSDTLIVAINTDCSLSYLPIWIKGGSTLATAPDDTTSFVPTAGEWRTETLVLDSLAGNSFVQIAFINFSGWGNNVFIDNVNLTGTGVPSTPVANFSVNRNAIFVGESVDFTDLSANVPTTWVWGFPGAVPSSSTSQNPTGITYNTAGSYDVSLFVSNTFGNDTKTETGYIDVIGLDSSGCVLLANFNPADTLTLYQSNGWGYVAGHNNFADVSKAEKFTAYPPGADLTSASIYFGAATSGSPTSKLTVNVWDNTGAGGAPGAIIASEDVLLSAIVTDVSNQDLTTVNFSTPATITTDFYVGITITYAAGDTVGILTNRINNTLPGTAWEQFSDLSWHAYNSAQSWGINVSHIIIPELCVAGQAICDVPLNPRTSKIEPKKARLEWDSVSGAHHYMIRGRNVNNPTWTVLTHANGLPNYRDISGLPTGAEIIWQVKAVCDPSGAPESNWSVADTFALVCMKPDSTWTGPVSGTAARFNWTKVTGAIAYHIKGKKSSSSTFTNITIGNGNATSKDVFNLDPGTQYEWKIRAICTNSGQVSVYTQTLTFTTSGSGRLAGSSEEPTIDIYPNPGHGVFNLRMNTIDSEGFIIEVLSPIGKIVHTQDIQDIDGSESKIDLSSYPNGVYLVRMKGNGWQNIQRLVKVD